MKVRIEVEGEDQDVCKRVQQLLSTINDCLIYQHFTKLGRVVAFHSEPRDEPSK